MIRRIACRYGRDATTREDLASVAIVAVLESERDYDPGRLPWMIHAYRVASHAVWNDVRRERRRKHEPIDPDSLSADSPLPKEETFALMRLLSDNEARVVELACGLGGGPMRSGWEVAWITRRQPTSIDRNYRSGLRKLREAMSA
jgi:DNA-directed RNA polymerase specialized sigma24 family protein